MKIKLTQNDITVELVHTETLQDGDYLRLFLERRINKDASIGANALTFLKPNLTMQNLGIAAGMIMDAVYDRLRAGHGITRLVNKMSWFSESWLEETCECPSCEGDGCCICRQTGVIHQLPIERYMDLEDKDDRLIPLDIIPVVPAHEFEEKPDVLTPVL